MKVYADLCRATVPPLSPILLPVIRTFDGERRAARPASNIGIQNEPVGLRLTGDDSACR